MDQDRRSFVPTTELVVSEIIAVLFVLGVTTNISPFAGS